MKKALIALLWLYTGWTTGSALVFFLAAPAILGPLTALAGLAVGVALVHHRPLPKATLSPEPAA
jgi:hypothetical protein